TRLPVSSAIAHGAWPSLVDAMSGRRVWCVLPASLPHPGRRRYSMRRPSLLALALPLFCLGGCNRSTGSPVFKLLSEGQTGISFANTITTSDSLNVETDIYAYNGAGVGVGDIDNDGRPDIFFAGNMVSSRL